MGGSWLRGEHGLSYIYLLITSPGLHTGDLSPPLPNIGVSDKAPCVKWIGCGKMNPRRWFRYSSCKIHQILQPWAR